MMRGRWNRVGGGEDDEDDVVPVFLTGSYDSGTTAHQ